MENHSTEGPSIQSLAPYKAPPYEALPPGRVSARIVRAGRCESVPSLTKGFCQGLPDISKRFQALPKASKRFQGNASACRVMAMAMPNRKTGRSHQGVSTKSAPDRRVFYGGAAFSYGSTAFGPSSPHVGPWPERLLCLVSSLVLASAWGCFPDRGEPNTTPGKTMRRGSLEESALLMLRRNVVGDAHEPLCSVANLTGDLCALTRRKLVLFLAEAVHQTGLVR